MPERWMVDRARDRLIVTRARMLKLHDRLRFGLLPRDQAEVTSAVILAQMELAIAAVEAASRSLRGERWVELAEPEAVAEAAAVDAAR